MIAYSDIDVRNVPYHIILSIENGKRCDTLVVHELEGICERFIAAVYHISCLQTLKLDRRLLYGKNGVRSDIQVADQLWVQLVDGGEALSVFPEELDQPQLCEYANNVGTVLLGDQHSMHATAKHLDRLCQIRRLGEGYQRLFLAQVLDIFEWNRLSFPSLPGELVKRRNVGLLGVRKAYD